MPGRNRAEQEDNRSEQEMRLLGLLGNTLLFEENHLVGFLPLHSFL